MGRRSLQSGNPCVRTVGLVVSLILLASCTAGRSNSRDSNTKAPGSVGNGIHSLLSLVVRSATKSSTDIPNMDGGYVDTQYHATIVSISTHRPFTVFSVSIRVSRVNDDSSALTSVKQVSSFKLPSTVERGLWKAAGSPSLRAAQSPTTLITPPGQFSFVPQGSTFTSAEVRSLSARPQIVLELIKRHLLASVGADPSPALLLRQLSYLLATAPVSKTSRIALWRAVETLAGRRLCGRVQDLLGRSGQTICADAAGEEVLVVVQPATSRVIAVEQVLLRPSQTFPALGANTLITSDSFTSLTPSTNSR